MKSTRFAKRKHDWVVVVVVVYYLDAPKGEHTKLTLLKPKSWLCVQFEYKMLAALQLKFSHTYIHAALCGTPKLWSPTLWHSAIRCIYWFCCFCFGFWFVSLDRRAVELAAFYVACDWAAQPSLLSEQYTSSSAIWEVINFNEVSTGLYTLFTYIGNTF